MPSKRSKRPPVKGGELIRRWRDGRKLSQKAAAAMFGVGQSTWSDWEADKAAPRITHALELWRVTETPLEAWAA